MTKLLDAGQVAETLGVCYERALQIMAELPNCNVGKAPSANRRHLRLSEDVLTRYMRGEIQREPWRNAKTPGKSPHCAPPGAEKAKATRAPILPGPWGSQTPIPYRREDEHTNERPAER